MAEPSPPAAAVAAQFGMARAGARPGLAAYGRDLWARRHFVLAFARAYNAVGYSSSFLGQFWQVLTPLLNAAVYFLVFGVILDTSRGVPNYIGFLVIGIFVFHYTSNAILTGSRAITSNIGLTRALHFPRATLPVATTVIALQQLLVSLVVLLPIILITGERPRLGWLLVLPALVLQTVFCLGCAFILARVGARIPDTAQILPFVLRTWLYLSGIFYSVKQLTDTLNAGWLQRLLEINPGAVYVELFRDALLGRHDPFDAVWPVAAAWAVGTFLFGYVFFWQAEEQYGRG